MFPTLSRSNHGSEPGWCIAALALVQLFVAGCCPSFAQDITLRVPLASGEEIAEVTFNPTRISESVLLRALEVSESGTYSIPDILPELDPGASATERATQADAAHNVLRVSEWKTHELQPGSFPPELAPVVSFLRQERELWEWVESRELAYFEGGDATVLSENHGDLSPVRCCPGILDRIRGAKKIEATRLVRFDWHNCVLRAGRRLIGEYPKAAWEDFLKHYGIKERLISTEED